MKTLACKVRDLQKTQVIVLSPDALSLLAALAQHGAFVFERRNRRKIFEKALTDAGIENFRWHDLRHTHATLLRQAGVALEIVQRSLGHQSIKTTQRYAHVADHEMRAALQKLPSITPIIQGAATVIPFWAKSTLLLPKSRGASYQGFSLRGNPAATNSTASTAAAIV